MAANYPVSVFHFQVEWGGSRVGFTEVSGLDIEIQPIDYREGSYKSYQVTKMPGIPQFTNINLKRGILKGDDEFHQWLATIRLNQVERRDVTISLLNENHEPLMVWTVFNAWPSKVTGPGLNSTSNEVAIEEIELSHEGLTVEAIG
ncbi:phage tail protein [Wandonia haliotis]|uniref:Phage tail protein n=1 Tax=Wandonia haliotis TaxID=574963 RepID=A0ABP3Y4J2_9FLAO